METFAKEFEQFIISGFREETLVSLIPGGISEQYFNLCKRINDFESQDHEALYRDIKEYEQKDSSQDTGGRLILLYLMKKFDTETDEEKKKEILEKLNSKYKIFQNKDFPKPIHFSQFNTNIETNEKLTSVLNEEIFDYDKILNKIYKENIIDQSSVEKLEEKSLHFIIDLTRLTDTALLDLLERNLSNPLSNCLQKIYFYHHDSKLLEKIAHIMKLPEYVSRIGASLYLQGIHHNMTTTQIEKFLCLVPKDFPKDYMINELINRRFTSALKRAKNDFTKRKILLEIYEFLKEKPLKYNSMKSDNILLILENGLLTNCYDIDLFKQYLENPIDTNNNQYKLYEKKLENLIQSNSVRQTICNIQNKSTGEEKAIVQKYLKHFFVFEGKTMDEFSPFLQTDYLLKEYYTSLVLRGEEDDKIINFLPNSTYEALIKSVDIKICEHNKELFKVDEAFEIDVDIKNVQTLFVKTFEINTENYYYKNLDTINSALSLEGLIATYEETYLFSDKPQKLVRRNFKFEKIPCKRGIFIIEFIGNGYSSRAVIKKGSLSLVSKCTPNGKIFYILDEAQNICIGEKTGIWVKKEFYKSDLTTGAIIIPYQRSASTEKAILIDQDFAEITELTLDTEQYRLEASYIYNKESFLMGNVTKLLIKPFLFVNNRLIDSKFLNNIKITVNLIKLENSQEIPITTVYDNSAQFKEKLLNNEEIEVEFQIPPRLTNITIILEAEIENKSQETKNVLCSKKTIIVDAKDCFSNSIPTNNNNYFKLFLRKFDQQYKVILLCKNGEPQANVEIKFNFIHTFNKTRIINIKLKTNEKGEASLGRLEHVQIILAESICIGGILREIFYLKSANHIGYPSTIDLIEGEDIQFPIIDEDINTMYFFSLDDNKVIENLTGRIKINLYKNDQSSSGVYNKYKTIMIKELKEGTYKLGIETNEITVNVHKGKYWQSDQYIITENKIIEKSSNKSPIHLEKFEVDNIFSLEEGDINMKETLQKVKIKVSSNTFNPRVHLFAYQFVNNIEGISSSDITTITQQGLNSNFYFQQWKNMFMSNRLLNEEIQYVLDRKHYERFMGNSLDKPSLLVKRQFVRDTSTDIVDAMQGTNFQRIQPGLMKAQQCAFDGAFSQKCNSRDLGQSAIEIQHIRKKLEENASTFHNFLACSPLILTNLKPNEDGEISVEIDLKNYTVLHALVIDDKGAYEDSLYLPYTEFAKRDLRMNMSVDHDKNFSEIRKTSLIHKGNSHSITDITSTSYQIIDSIEKYLSYFMLSTQYSMIKKDYNDLSFLVKFDQLDEKEKLKKLSNYFCHEVNIYLFFKHHEFFIKNVRHVLCYKTEKSFVDFFLLENLPKVKEFSGPNRINTLNSFEKCLLIYAIRKESPELAKTIAKNLRNDSETLKISAEETKMLFNIIINMKIDNELSKSVEIIHPELSTMKRGATREFREVNFSVKECAPQMAKKRTSRMEPELFGVSQAQITAANIKNNMTREGGKSKEYCEAHYYNTNSKDSKFFILPNGFYADLAEYWANDLDTTLSKGFLSPNIILPIKSISQLITTISVLDFASTKTISHSYNRLEGRGLEIVANSNMIVFTKEISETTADIRSNLMLAQIINKSNANSKDEDGFNPLVDEEEKDTEDVQLNTQQYLLNETYKHETIVTNVSNKTLTFELLINIPEGALPVQGSDYTSTVNLTLLKFKTTKIETFFYFSKPGKFMQTPPSASIEGLVIAKLKPMLYDVCETISKQSLCTLNDVLESGTKKEILEFLNKNDNLSSDNLSKIYWLLNDEEFYRELIKILRYKGIYDKTIWSFSFKHNDHTTLREYLEADTNLKSILGPQSDFKLIKVASHNNYNIMNHLDYHPILNARANKVGQNKSSSIKNKEFRETYEAFINYLISLNEIDAKSYLRLSYYLILQDRIEEAFKIFQRIDPNMFNSLDSYMLQYDYISAYIDFSMGYPEFSIAREICEKYKNFPMKSWRELFEEIEDQLQEYDGKQSYDDIDKIIDEEKKSKLSLKIASVTEPKLNFSVENKNLNIMYTSIDSITIKFYLIDLEILFSRTPFIQQNSDDFSFVQPNFIQIIQVESSPKENIFISPIPSKYINSNLLIEVSSSSKKVFNTHYSTSLLVNISEAIGEIKVLDKNLKPLTKAYVKCFAKHTDDSVKFYKDGYTDLRGRFNYISLNSEAINSIMKFSIFIMHDELGSLIKEANPPPNMESLGPVRGDNMMQNSYDDYINYRQEIKQKWKSQK